MAIIKSAVWSEVRGSVGGTTYARNKAGQYARNRSKPVNPNTVNQSAVRALFGGNSFAYGSLTVEEVAAWNQFAQGYPAINRVGDTYTPSGRQMFMLCNQNLVLAGQGPITVPPYDIPVVPPIDISAAALTPTTDAGPPITVDTFPITGVVSDSDTKLIVVQATPNMQPSRQSYRNRMRTMGSVTSGDPINIGAAFNLYFGTPSVTAGQIVNVRVAAVDAASGVSSAWMYLQAVLPAPGP